MILIKRLNDFNERPSIKDLKNLLVEASLNE